MNWNDITVAQFQELNLLEEYLAPIDKLYATIAICHNIDLDVLDNMPQAEVNRLGEECLFTINQSFKSTMVKRYKNYRFVPDITKIKSGVSRYIEVKHWSKNHIPNMHYILSSMVAPQRKNWLGIWRDIPYNSKDYEVYASDLRYMPVTVAMSWIGFFLQVLEKSKSVSENSLKNKMILKMMWKHKMTKKQVKQIVDPLWTTLAGSTK
jgi:hypothetical protein